MSTQIGNQFGSSGKTRARRRTAPQAEATAAAVENTYTTKSDQSKHSQCSKSGMHRLSSNRLKRQFLAQCPHTKKVAATSSCRAAALFVAIVMILTNFNNLIISRQQPLLCQAAVVRPTVFSDLNTSQQQQDNNAVQKQQQQQAAQTPASSPSQVPNQQTQQSQQSNLNTLSAAALASGAVAATSAGEFPIKCRSLESESSVIIFIALNCFCWRARGRTQHALMVLQYRAQPAEA